MTANDDHVTTGSTDSAIEGTTPARKRRKPASRHTSGRRLWTVFGISVVPMAAVILIAALIHTIPVDRVAQAVPPPTHDPEKVTPDDDDPPPDDTFFIADAQPGAPRPWESGIQVAPYSTMNILNRNVYTVVPIVSWSGVGPGMSMNLYHNSATVDADYDTTRGMGFGLGPGWTTSFSAQLLLDSPISITVIADDGTRDYYDMAGSDWVAPPGVHDELTFDATAQVYHLTHKNQSYHEFDATGLLIAAVDALGHRLTIQRVGGRLDTVTDAAGRVLQFVYVGDILDRIVDPIQPEDDPAETQPREWTLDYSLPAAPGALRTIIDPMNYRTSFQYDLDGRIKRTKEKEALGELRPWYVLTYEFIYQRDRDALRTVKDPIGLLQSFDSTNDPGYAFHVTHTDKRGSNWEYHAWQAEPQVGDPAVDPPIVRVVNPLGQISRSVYDDDRNMVQSIDALGHTWTFTYDDRGNRLTAASPLHVPGGYSHRQSWSYDALNNLTTYTDASGNVTMLEYDLAGYPTLLHSIREPANDQGIEPVTT